jgi:hypothetical protein
MIATGTAFVLTGSILLRTAANPVRALLVRAANPLLIVEPTCSSASSWVPWPP